VRDWLFNETSCFGPGRQSLAREGSNTSWCGRLVGWIGLSGRSTLCMGATANDHRRIDPPDGARLPQQSA